MQHLYKGLYSVYLPHLSEIYCINFKQLYEKSKPNQLNLSLC